MGKTPRLTDPTIKVLQALMSGGLRELSGAEIAKKSGLASGTMYPVLYRLEDAGWLDSRWEKGNPADLGRPRRRYYRITAECQKQLSKLVDGLTPVRSRLAWST